MPLIHAASRGDGPAPGLTWDAATPLPIPRMVRCAALTLPVAYSAARSEPIFPTMVTVGQHDKRH